MVNTICLANYIINIHTYIYITIFTYIYIYITSIVLSDPYSSSILFPAAPAPAQHFARPCAVTGASQEDLLRCTAGPRLWRSIGHSYGLYGFMMIHGYI